MSLRLPRELIREVKHAAVDLGVSQQAFIEEAVRARLQRLTRRGARTRPGTNPAALPR